MKAERQYLFWKFRGDMWRIVLRLLQKQQAHKNWTSYLILDPSSQPL